MRTWYNESMYNWSTDEKELKKDSEQYLRWKIEQLVNFGLGGEKIREVDLKKYWSEIQLDPHRRKFLSLLLYGTIDSH